MRFKICIVILFSISLLTLVAVLGLHRVAAKNRTLTAVTFPTPQATTPPCVDKTIAKSESPDKLWNAISYSELCEGDYPFQTSTVVLIKLVSVASPSISPDVFAVDTGTEKDLTPIFAWSAPHSLMITTPKSIFITLQKTSYGAVSISYKYTT